MSTKVAVDTATPRINGETTTPEKMVDTGTTTIAAILASPNINNAPNVKAAATDWAAANTALDGNNQNKAAGRKMLDTALINEPPLMRRWHARKLGVASAIAIFADGSKQVVQSFEVDVEQKVTPPEAIVPWNLRPMKTRKPSNASARWDKSPGATGYLLQHATNPSDPTTYSAPLNVTGVTFHLPGQTVGTTVYYRVLALDKRLPGGQTAYTPWVAVLVTN